MIVGYGEQNDQLLYLVALDTNTYKKGDYPEGENLTFAEGEFEAI